MSTVLGGLDWKLHVMSVTDGDTLRGHLSRVERIANGWRHVIESDDPRGAPLRLIIVNTPEFRKDPAGAAAAKQDLTGWLVARTGHLRVETWESAGWDRTLADVYSEGDRGDTATQFLLQQGWPIYTG